MTELPVYTRYRSLMRTELAFFFFFLKNAHLAYANAVNMVVP